MPRNVEDDFLAAFQRISKGAPTHPKLRARLAAGKKVEPNQSTVSLEAGHSRTLISLRVPGYERICNLLNLQTDAAQQICENNKHRPETASERLARLSSELRHLTEQRDRFATLLSEAYLALDMKDKEIARLMSEKLRRQSSNDELGGMDIDI